MNEEEIRALEPKYMGNTRHLTPGEAGEILNDPDNKESDDDGIGISQAIIPALLADNFDGESSMRV
jgi:hypothetical protein